MNVADLMKLLEAVPTSAEVLVLGDEGEDPTALRGVRVEVTEGITTVVID